ncbi:UNVERIFIED_CONTAM: hypothetical protein FKN15_052956 [Acipenser sinensis]
MATGEACAHIQGLGTNPAPKSEPLDTSTQSADASTSNSSRAPGIRPQEWAIRARTRPQATLAEHREFSPKNRQSGGDAKAVNHPSMATGEACANIQGLGTNPAPKSEPLDTSTQSADASTSNSGRAPGIQPQE